jgi:hypothetical protein
VVHRGRGARGFGSRALIVTVVSLTAALWGGALQGVAMAAPAQAPGPDTKGAGVSVKWMDAAGGTVPVSHTGNARDVHEAASAGAGRPSGRAPAWHRGR